MIKIYYVPSQKITREYLLIKQGLQNHPNVELVDAFDPADFVFLFYATLKHNPEKVSYFPPEKLVFIDYHDKPTTTFDVDCLAYFKRSWVELAYEGDVMIKRSPPRPANYHPINLAIMDEFCIEEDYIRDVRLSCTIRPHKRHPGRPQVLKLLRDLNIEGNTQIGELNSGSMDRFNDSDMRAYFKLLKRSNLIVTCNPSKHEGDHRTWEAFASGAMVFVDRMYIPMKHPLVSGKHCIIYDISDRGLELLRNELQYYLANPAKAEEIAMEGHAFTMKYHRTKNRIDNILDVIT